MTKLFGRDEEFFLARKFFAKNSELLVKGHPNEILFKKAVGPHLFRFATVVNLQSTQL